MIKTNLERAEKELIEVINLFGEQEEFNIRHKFTQGENKLVNTIVVNGKVFAYGNLVKATLDEILKERLIKRYAKLSLYKALSAFTGKTFPWGSLTGIRPTKLAYNVIKERGEFEDYFINTLKVSEEKTQLVNEIINSQKPYYQVDGNNTDFFVFVPFCPTRCKYCSFICADMTKFGKYENEYVDVLIKEIEESAKLVKNLRSVYVGGGTPVALSDYNLDRLLSAVDKINTGVEYTVEAGRPDCITKSNLKILKEHGVNRICINPQTFSDETLKAIGRNHTANDVVEKFNMVKDDFIVNMDFIAGLEGETFSSFKAGIDKAIALNPDNITVHTLCIKRGATLAETDKRLSGEQVEDMVNYARFALKDAGYSPYYLYRQKYMAGNLENTGYSKKGKECLYNIDTMEEIASTIACGANAISKRYFNDLERIERVASPKDIKTYLEKMPQILEEKSKLFE